MQTKLVTSTARVPGLAKVHLERQDSADSQKFGNPFNEEELSEYANDVVDAVKSGNLFLNKIVDDEVGQNDENKNSVKADADELSKDFPPLSVPQESKTKEIKIEHSLVISPKQSEIVEHILIPKEKTKNKFSCCAIS